MCPSPRVPANPLATPRRPAAPFTAACKRAESPRPGSGAGRWPAAQSSCPGRLAGVERLRKLSPRKGWLPCPRLNSRGMTQASPPGQAEGRRRVSLFLPGLGNYSRAPVGAPCLRPGLGALSEFEGGGPGRRRNSERDSHSGAGGETERKHKGRGTNPGKWKTGRSGETERKGPEPEKERNGNRETETRRWGDRNTERDKKEAETYGSGEARGAARPGQSSGDARAPRPSSGRCPGGRAARPALDPPGFLSAAHLPPFLSWPRNSYREMETPVESGDRLGAQGCSLATPCRAHVPRPGAPSPQRSRARRRRLRTVPWAGGRAGGAALRLRPKPLEAGSPRAGPGGTYRARGGGGKRGAPAGSCGAVCGPRGAGSAPPGGSGRRPAGLAAAPRGSAGLRCALSAAPGGRAVRGSGEPSGSDVRGVSAPNRERGRGQWREGREKERAGGRAGPLPPGAQEGAPQPPGAPAPSPRRPRAPGRAPARSDGAAELPGPP